jgi:hypothetical protein
MTLYYFQTTAAEAIEHCSEYGCPHPAVCECATDGRPLCERHSFPLGGKYYGRMAHQVATLNQDVALLRAEIASLRGALMLGGGYGSN